MKKSATLTVTIDEQDGWIDILPNGQLTENQRQLVRLAAKEAVGEYIRQTHGGSVKLKNKDAKPALPETGFLRLPEILQLIPVGKTCWWEGVKNGRFPQPVKLSTRCTAWRAEDIQNLILRL